MKSKLPSEEIIAFYKEGESSRSLASKYQVCRKTITNLLKRNGVDERHGVPRKYKLDESAFDIMSEECLYWVGFLMADGCIQSRNGIYYVLKITLAERDKTHLKKFLKFLKSNAPIYNEHYGKGGYIDGKCVTVTISSRRIVERLGEFGIHPRKSLTANPAQVCCNSRDFWRGMLDGDGWVRHDDGRLELLGSRTTVEKFIGYVNKVIKTNSTPRPRGKIWRAGFANKILLNHFYKGAVISLDRKSGH